MLKDACRAIVQFMFTQVLIISFISSLPYFLAQCHLEVQQPRSWLPSSSCCCSPGWRGRAGGWLHYCRCDHFPGEFLPSSGELLSCWETPTIGERADKYLKAIEEIPAGNRGIGTRKPDRPRSREAGRCCAKVQRKQQLASLQSNTNTFDAFFLFIESCTNPFSRLWNITNNFNTLNKQRWNDSIQSVISDYQVFFIIATSLCNMDCLWLSQMDIYWTLLEERDSFITAKQSWTFISRKIDLYRLPFFGHNITKQQTFSSYVNWINDERAVPFFLVYSSLWSTKEI